MSEDKNNPTKLSLQNVVGAVAGKGDDDFDRMMVKLRMSKVFTVLPDWMANYTLKNVVPSQWDGITCYTNLVALKYLTYKYHHPANVIEELSVTKPVTFSVKEMTYKEGKGDKVVVLANMKGLPMKEKASSEYCAATTSTLLSYYVRAKGEDMMERIPDNSSNELLGFTYAPGMTTLRGETKVKDSSATEARDAMYAVLADPDNRGVNYYLAAVMGTKFSDAYSHSPGLTTELQKYYDDEDIPQESRIPGMILTGYKPRSAKAESIEVMWRYLNSSRGIRGQDSAGCGALTVGYYLGYEMSRSMAKTLTMVYDVLAVMEVAGVDTVMMYTHAFPVNVMAMLVANHKYIVVMSSTYPVCRDGDAPGLYSSTKHDHIMYFDYKFTEPIIRSSGISYGAIPSNLGYNTLYFSYAYITPDLFERNDIGFFLLLCLIKDE